MSTVTPSTNPPGGIRYSLGATNAVNEAKGGPTQTIALPPNQYSEIRLLGASTHGNKSGSFTMNYTDGSSSAQNVDMQDWAVPGTLTYAVTSMTMPYAHISGGIGNGNFYVFQYTLNPTSGKTVKSITMPNNSDMHVFAVSMLPG